MPVSQSVKTNCPNCGAPIEKDKQKCAYCGTWYIDLTMIDFDTSEPIFLSIKKNGHILTQKVRPQTVSFENYSDSLTTYPLNDKILSITPCHSFETNIQFIAMPFHNGNLCEITTE